MDGAGHKNSCATEVVQLPSWNMDGTGHEEIVAQTRVGQWPG